MVWAGVALLGLHLIIEKMARLHTIIMVGGGLAACAGWASDAARRAEKARIGGVFSALRTGAERARRVFSRAADQSVESESDYLFWFRFFTVCRR